MTTSIMMIFLVHSESPPFLNLLNHLRTQCSSAAMAPLMYTIVSMMKTNVCRNAPKMPEAHHRPGKNERQHAHEDPGGGVLAEDVAEETHAQREDAREVADHLDREHERRQQQASAP